MYMQPRKWLATTVAAAAMALAAGSASALETTGTFTPISPYTGASSFSFVLSGSTDLSVVLVGTGGVSGILYGPASITADDVLLLSKRAYYTFEGLSAGSYTFDFIGPSTGTYKLSLISDIGVSVTPVPEPESLALALAGLGVLGLLGRRRLTATSAQQG